MPLQGRGGASLSLWNRAIWDHMAERQDIRAWTPATFAYTISGKQFSSGYSSTYSTIHFLVKCTTMSGTVVDLALRGWWLHSWRKQNTIKWIDTWRVKMIPDPNAVMHYTALLSCGMWAGTCPQTVLDERRNREMACRDVSCLPNLILKNRDL